MTRDSASERQVQAADPAASTWLSANAGSGKTRVLTDRVARLLLGGVQPQRVLCLTYTKAAAAEMQNRLFRRLGEWAMLEDAPLRAALSALGVDGPVDARLLAEARRLFARAIETPGGLRIQTIHSFCASLLRRFPLEAGVTPQFTEMDDRTARRLREEIVEDMADRLAPDLVADLARVFSGEDLERLTADIAHGRARFDTAVTRERALALLGAAPDDSLDRILSDVFRGGEDVLLGQVAAILAAGSKTDAEAAVRLAALATQDVTPSALMELEALFLTGRAAKEPFSAKIGSFPTKATRAALGPLLPPLEALMARVEAARSRRIAVAAAERMLVLHRFAGRFLPEYALRKARRGWLDFDDLITKARDLLTDPSVAQWVLFRLDGGIDHILVDEAQDTGPDQWRVIELLAQEFTAGRGARDVPRTIFVVGDKKQSIYSFQGADLEAFDRMKAEFRRRLAEAQTHLADLTLDHSFRSSPAILRVVDMTFDAEGGQGLGGEVRHIAFKGDMPGRVDLWPAIEPSAEPEPGAWYDPVDLVGDAHHNARLAGQVANWIRDQIAAGRQIPTDHGPRPMRAGDVLILVQRRSALFSDLIRSCKAAGLPVAGADRLRLGGELAVRDLGALLAFLATPEDDLSLAAALRSPLFGWTEQQLFSLAQGRSGYLWAALRDRAAEFAATLAILEDLRDRSDYLRPYDLIERVLTRHRGRQNLLARLGDEAEDGIDELLSQALAYERSEIPSLTGFIGWLQSDDVEVKRQLESAGDRIRVMTVHGAKGLEAPVVILPETQDRAVPAGSDLLDLPEGLAAWRMRAEENPAALARALDARQEKARAESRRLLYVALTRAQCWLIVAAAGKTESAESWYRSVERGLERAGAEDAGGAVRRHAHGAWPPDARAPTVVAPAAEVALPAWAQRPAPPPPPEVEPLSPSDLGGAKALPGEPQPERDADARARGSALHMLLEHLPGHPEADWPALAAILLAEEAPGAVSARLSEARRVLSTPGLAWLFGPDAMAEVGLTGEIAGQRFLGAIDRLILKPGRVTAIDFKSNRLVPDRPEAVPEGILRQMGAYARLLEQLHPDREVEVAVLWTTGARLMPLPRALVMAALQRAGFP